jgi:hypothetical protein
MSSPLDTSKLPFRQLRRFAFDPLTWLDPDTAEINQIIYTIIKGLGI